MRIARQYRLVLADALLSARKNLKHPSSKQANLIGLDGHLMPAGDEALRLIPEALRFVECGAQSSTWSNRK
jgi:hypothetical protein